MALESLIVLIIVGAIAGWLAGQIVKGMGFGLIGNIVVGIVGAFIGGWLLSPYLGAGTINSNDFSVGGLAVSLLGAVILLAIVNLFRRSRIR